MVFKTKCIHVTQRTLLGVIQIYSIFNFYFHFQEEDLLKINKTLFTDSRATQP